MSARGKNIGEHNCDYDYGIAIYKEGTLNGNIKRYSWGFNMFTYSSLNGNGLYVNSVCPCINWIFATKTWGPSVDVFQPNACLSASQPVYVGLYCVKSNASSSTSIFLR